MRGVRFVDVSAFCAADRFDTLVVWRSAELLELPLRARRLLLDLHDMPRRAELSAARRVWPRRPQASPLEIAASR